MLRGKCYITGNRDLALQTFMVNNANKIINLDEDETDKYFLDISVPGTYLLPPIEALRAEIDGNELMYDQLYCEHLCDNHSRAIIAALVYYMYQGMGDLMFYLPDTYNSTRDKLVFHITNIYGIHIGDADLIDQPPIPDATGIPRQSFIANPERIPQWLDLLYLDINAISWREYLYELPLGMRISDYAISKMLEQLNPYGETLTQKVEYLYHLAYAIKGNKRLICPLECIRR